MLQAVGGHANSSAHALALKQGGMYFIAARNTASGIAHSATPLPPIQGHIDLMNPVHVLKRVEYMLLEADSVSSRANGKFSTETQFPSSEEL